jgi:tetratricopeptide (TPR) repeat protein
LAALIIQSLAVQAMAQATEAPPQTAVEHYNRGREHYQAGRYREALVELEAALTTDPRSPNLVYNVARVHELLGQLDAASQFYQRYRDMLPQNETEERERVDAILLRLEGAQEQVGPIAAPPADEWREREPDPPTRMKRGVADAAFWTMATMGAAALLTSAATGALALKEEKDARDFVVGADGTAEDLSKSYRRADRLALSSDATLVIGTTFAVTSILLYMLREKAVPIEGPAEKTASFSLGASSKGLMLTFGAAL